MRSTRRIAVLCLLLAIPAPGAELDRTDSLALLGRVWSTVKFLHPQLMVRDVDWDGALLRAVPQVREATTHEALARAIGGMLAELDDPLTRIEQEPPAREAPTGPFFTSKGDVLVVDLGAFADADAPEESEKALRTEFEKATRVVLDMRTDREGSVATMEWFLPKLGPLTDEPVPGIARRFVMHSGYAPQSGSSSGGYFSAFLTVASPSIAPAPNGKQVPRIVFVTGANVPAIALALVSAGKAGLVSEVPPRESSIGDVRAIPLGGGWVARVRTSEPAVSGITADAIVAPGANDATLARAIALATKDKPFAIRQLAARAEVPHAPRDEPYATPEFPDLPHRMLAIFRYWSVIDSFYPYKELIDDWDAVLREGIPKFEAAADAKEYARAVMWLVARVEDGHSGVSGATATEVIGGPWTLPLEIRAVENEFVVTAANRVEGVAVGDVVTAIDGEDLRARVERLRPLITASTDATRLNRLLAVAKRGAMDSEASVTLRRADGTVSTVKVARVKSYLPPEPEGDPWRVLEGNVGYVDLRRLTVSQVGPMFEALMQTRAIVFDMRGYPRGTAWTIAPRINTNGARFGAQFRRRQVMAMSDEEGRSGFFFEQPLPAGDASLPLYKGRTVMLIDDRTISQAEHSGLFYEAANGTKFIGTNSAGANGDVTSLFIPGGLTAYFTGHDVRHADGRQLQRIGLVPDVVVAPTLRGVRDGRDEVLERALEYLGR